MNYFMLGLNHRTAPVALREKLALNAVAARHFLDAVRESGAVSEAAVISTCNRVEVYSATQKPEQAREAILKALTPTDGLDPLQLADHFYSKSGAEAVAHLFAVTASLDSQVLGENQITGQVKEAFDLALASGATGACLNRLFNRALFVAKRVRSETDIGRGNVSVGSAAVVLARRIFDDLSDKSVVLFGAGEIGELCLRYLADVGGARVTILNRTLARAENLSAQGLGEARALEEFAQVLQAADILITSVAEPLATFGYDVSAFREVMSQRGFAPLFIIDLGVPRNVAVEVGGIDNVYLYNVDDLRVLSSEGEAARRAEADSAKNLIDEEVRLFYENHLVGDAGPAIARLGRKFEDIRRAEVDRTLGRMPGLGAEEKLAIERMTQAMVSRFLHDPILGLRTGVKSEPGVLEIFRRLFRLDEDE